MAGVGFSLLILIFPMARPGLTIRHEKCIDHPSGQPDDKISVSKEAVVIEPNQGLKFPGIEYIKDKVMKYGVYEEPPKAVILNATHLAGTDFSTVQGLTQICEYFIKHGLSFVIACPNVSILLLAMRTSSSSFIFDVVLYKSLFFHVLNLINVMFICVKQCMRVFQAEVKTILENAEVAGIKIASSEEEALRMSFGQYRSSSSRTSSHTESYYCNSNRSNHSSTTTTNRAIMPPGDANPLVKVQLPHSISCISNQSNS